MPLSLKRRSGNVIFITHNGERLKLTVEEKPNMSGFYLIFDGPRTFSIVRAEVLANQEGA